MTAGVRWGPGSCNQLEVRKLDAWLLWVTRTVVVVDSW